MPDNNITPDVPFEQLLGQSNFHFPNGVPAVEKYNGMGTQPTVGQLDARASLANLQAQVNSKPDYNISPEGTETFSPLQVDTSGRFPYQRIGADNEDLYGRGQTWTSKAFHGIVKGLSTAASTAVEGTIGTVAGLADVISGKGLSSFYDNDFSRAIQRWNDAAENVLPNYYTAKERDAKWWEPNNLFTANFVWDKLVKNVGFSLGAIYSGEAVTKGLTLLKDLIPLFDVAKAAEAAATMEKTLGAVPELSRFGQAQNIIRNASNSVNRIASIANSPTAERFLTSTLGAATEGGIEALQGVNDFRNQKIQEYKDKYGVAPVGDDLDKINSVASDLGNARFGLNMLLLTATNYVQLPRILGDTYKDGKAIVNAGGEEIGATRRLADDTLERALPTTKFGKLAYAAQNIGGLLFAPSEAFEETAQYAIQKGVEDYYNKAYKGQGRDFLESLGTGWGAAFRDKEGLESLLLGGISGGFQQAYHAIQERGITGTGGKLGEATNAFINQANPSPLKLTSDQWTKEYADAAARGQSLLAEQKAALRQGDVLEYEDSKYDSVHNYLAPRIKYGRYDLVKSDIADYRKLAITQEGLDALKQKGYAAESDTIETFSQRLTNFEQHADNIKSLYESLSLRYGGNEKYRGEVLDKMVYAASKVADYDSRIPELARDLTASGVDLTSVLAPDLFEGAKMSATGVKDALKVINDMQMSNGKTVTSDVKDELKRNLRDIIELSLRRKQFLKDYENIKANPEDYQTSPLPQRVEDVVLPQKEGRKTTQQKFQTGVQYSLRAPITREGNSIILAPKLTVLDNTLDKEVEATLPSGETTFVPKSQFRQYELSSFNNRSAEIEDKFKEVVPAIIKKSQFKGIQAAFATVDKSDVNALQEFVNQQNNSDLADEIVKAMRPTVDAIRKKEKEERAAAEKLSKDAEALKKLKEEQEKQDKKAGIPTTDDTSTDQENELDAINDNPKVLVYALLSKEAGFYDETKPKPHQQRHQSFLTLLGSVIGTPQSSKYKVLTITAKNEEKYGLKGLRDWVVDDIKNTNLSPETHDKYFNKDGSLRSEHEPIIKLYAIQTKDGVLPTDAKGNSIKTVGVDAVTSAGVFSVFNSDLTGVYTFGPRAGQTNYIGSKEDFEEAKAQFAAWRTDVLNTEDSNIYDILGVSRGVVLRDDQNKPVTQTALAKEEDLIKEGIVTIPTKEGAVTVNDTSLNFPVGQPLLKNGSNVEFLNNRTFSEKEANDIFKMFKEFAAKKSTPEGTRLWNFLSSIIYMRSPGTGTPSNSQVWVDAQGNYHFGTQLSIPFTEQSFESNKGPITDFLKSYFVKANNKYLKQEAFEEAYIQSDGQIGFRNHPTYSEFLLSDKLGVPYLQTRARRQLDENVPSIISRYTTLRGSEFDFISTEVKDESHPSQPSSSSQIDDEAEPFDGSNLEGGEEEDAFAGGVTFGGQKKETAPVETKKEQSTGLQFRKGKVTPEEKARLDELAAKRMKGYRDLGEYSMVDEVKKYSPIDVEKEIAYIKEKSPFSTEILSNFIRTPEGLYAWGKYKNMVISLYNKAITGTGYHELFEGVYKVFLSDAEKVKMYSEFTKRKGNFTFFDGYLWHNIPYSNATEFQMKEKLADEFADYISTKEKPEGFSIARWFQNLWNFIKSIFSGDVKIIDNIFANIDAAKYKSVPAVPLSVSESSEYSLGDVTYTEQYQTIRGIAIQTIQEMLNPDNPDSVSLTEFEETKVDVKEFYNGVYNRLEGIYGGLTEEEVGNEEQRLALKSYWDSIKGDWSLITELTSEYLKTYSIIEGNSNQRFNSENYNNRDYIDDSKYFLNDAKNTASRSIKLLIATLPETVFVKGRYLSRRNEVFMQEQVNYAKTFNGALYQLASLNSPKEKMEKLRQMAQNIPNFQKLYTRLNMQSNKNNPAGPMNDWKLKVRWFNVTSKQVPTAFIQFNHEDRTSSTGTTNLNSAVKNIVQGWIDSLKNLAISGGNNMAVLNENGDSVLLTKYINGDTATPEGKINFLNQLQIPFTMEMYKSLSGDQRTNFNDAVQGLRADIFGINNNRQSVPIADSKAWKASGNMDKLAVAFIDAGSDFESMFPNINGENTARFIATNKVSRDVNDINNATSLQDLYEVLPHLQQVKDSVYLNNILFQNGKRTNTKLSLGYMQGTVDSNNNPISGDYLSMNQRVQQEFNQNLNERYYVMVGADSKTQWMLQLINPVSYKAVATDALNWKTRWVEQMIEYYHTEQATYERLKSELDEKALEKRMGMFKTLSNGYTLSDLDFAEKLNFFLDGEISKQRTFLDQCKIVQGLSNGLYFWEGLDKQFLTRNNLNHNRLTTKDVDNILMFRTTNFMMNNAEMQKIFYGEALEYNDVKRYKLFLSPREASFHSTPEYNDFLNTELNSVGNIKLKDNLLGKWMFSDNMHTATMRSLKMQNNDLVGLASAYGNIDPMDGSAISTIVGGRERRIKGGNWTSKDQQEYDYQMSRDRQLMYQDGVLSNFNYQKKLQEHDAEVVKNGDPNASFIYVEKPIASGFVEKDGTYYPLADKFSIVSYSYAAVRNTNFRDHYVKMLKQNMSYIIMDTGRKIGPAGYNDFYNEDGTVNNLPYSDIVNVPFSIFGVQTDTSSKKEQQTRGTQVTKLILLNLYNGGVPITKEAGELAQHNIALLREQVEIGYQKLLKQIGAEDVDGKYRITDKKKVLNLIRNELLRRDVADSIKQQLQLTSDGQLKTAFEALPNYTQIKQILYAHVDKAITSPKVNGAPLVQVSGGLMEKYGVRKEKVNGKDVWVSSALKFYTEKEPWMEVMMPFRFGQKLREAGVTWNSEQELMDIIKNSPDATRILSGVGFRIPTQELSSVEHFRIKGFLPEEMGDTVVVPEEITAKAGSDFDIDKLSTYLQNLYVDKNKNLRIIPYFGIGEEAKQALSKWWLTEELAKMLTQYIDDETLNQPEMDIDKLYRESIENEYFNNMGEILSLKENFSRLVNPTEAETLKDIRNELVDLAPDEFGEGDVNILSPMFMTTARHNAVTMKVLIGAAALSQTGNSLAQQANLTINYDAVKSLRYNQREMVGNPIILLPHNQIDGAPAIGIQKDLLGNYISDKISGYITGVVDAFKDPFLPQINFNKRTAGVYMLLERLGVPNSKEYPIVSLFMNQPIIREFVKFADVKRVKNLTDFALRTQYSIFVAGRFKQGAEKMTAFPEGRETLTTLLKDNIKKYYNGVDLSKKENASQLLVLKEFTKYLVYANHLLDLQQSTNYDTANLNDNYSLAMKEDAFTKTMGYNVFSSPDKYLSISFIGNQRKALLKATDTLSDILTINNPITQKWLRPIFAGIANNWNLTADEKLGMYRKMEESLLNFLSHTQGDAPMNQKIKELMVDKNTSMANKLREIKAKIKLDDSYNSLKGNLILKQLMPFIRGKNVNSTKNVTLAVKARDIFSKNLYVDSFKQLLNNPITADFANDLITTHFLQSGVSNSYITIKDAIPAEDYSKRMAAPVKQLSDTQALQSFVETEAFYRNNAENPDLVKRVDNRDFPIYAPHPLVKELNSIVNKTENAPLTLWYPSTTQTHILHVNSYYEKPDDEEPIVRKTLLRRVESELGEGISVIMQKYSDEDIAEGEDAMALEKRYLYVQINAWGDGFRAQEYYDAPQPSVLSNGINKVEKELSPVQVYNFITNYQQSDVVEEGEKIENPEEGEKLSQKDPFEAFKATLDTKDC